MNPAVRIICLAVSVMILATVDAMAEPATRLFPQVIVSCFFGGRDSTNWATLTATNSKLSHRFTCGPAGQVSEIVWDFLGARSGHDLYRFTRRFPADTDRAVTVTNMVEFNGEALTVFKDSQQVIILEVYPGAPKPVPYIGDPLGDPRFTNVTVTCKLKAYMLRGKEYGAEELEKADAETIHELRWESKGFVMEIIEPEMWKGQTIGIHHDSPIGDSGDPLTLFQPGKLYQFDVRSNEIGNGKFWRCSVGWKRTVIQPKGSK